MKKISKLTLRKIDVEQSDILQKRELKYILGGYGEEGYGDDTGPPETCTACDNACHCVTLSCPHSSTSACMDWIMSLVPTATGYSCN